MKHRGVASASGAEAGEELLSNFRPGTRCDLTTTMCGEAFSDDLAVPVRNRHFVRVFGKVIPECLDVFELFVGRELIEPRRR
jgi:hypothetical protein